MLLEIVQLSNRVHHISQIWAKGRNLNHTIIKWSHFKGVLAQNPVTYDKTPITTVIVAQFHWEDRF